MLILQRKPGESFFIGDDIEVTLLSMESGRVRLAIEAPKSLSILRAELRGAMQENRSAAQEELPPAALLQLLRSSPAQDEQSSDQHSTPL